MSLKSMQDLCMLIKSHKYIIVFCFWLWFFVFTWKRKESIYATLKNTNANEKKLCIFIIAKQLSFIEIDTTDTVRIQVG